MTRWFANILIWIALTAEVEGAVFDGKWSTPLTTVGNLLFRPVFLPPWDVMVVVTLILSQRGASKGRVKVLTDAIALSLLSTLALWLWGVLRGGSAYQTFFQLHPFVLGMFAALLVVATCRTAAHVESLGKVFVFAALYRACVLILFYLKIAKDLDPPLATLTDHADSVLFVVGILVPLINAMERPRPSSIVKACLAAALLATAIVLNNRRIAWLGVGVGLLMIYLLLPKGKAKRRISRTMVMLSPLLVAYVVVGWGQKTGIFKPVGSISTMFGAHQDVSSIMRDIENYNLLRTLRSNPLLGTGWGWEYIEEVRAVDISGIFPQYRYLPHNSLLGVIAFTGALGFAGAFQVVAVAAYLHARVQRAATARIPRIAAMSCLVALMMVIVEMWGDVGFNHPLVNITLAIALGLAGRLPAIAGVMTPPATTPAPPAKAQAAVGGQEQAPSP